MARMTYVAMLEPGEDGIGVSFPDLPGCVSFGDSASDVVRNAEEALSLHLEGLAQDAEPYPEATDLRVVAAETRQDPAFHDAVFVLVTAEAPDEAERVNVYLTKSLLQRVDAHARAAGINRSVFFTRAANAFITGLSAKREALMDEVVGKMADRIAAGLVKSGAQNVRVSEGGTDVTFTIPD